MEIVVKLAIEKMNEEIERLKQTVNEQQKRIIQLEKNGLKSTPNEPVATKIDDELLTNEQVKAILKIGKNSLIKLARDGVLVPIRMNERTVRFSKSAIMDYIQQKQSTVI